MSNKRKMVRDIQARTGWNYQFCAFLVMYLGYDEVSRLVDEGASSDTLNELARKARATPL